MVAAHIIEIPYVYDPLVNLFLKGKVSAEILRARTSSRLKVEIECHIFTKNKLTTFGTTTSRQLRRTSGLAQTGEVPPPIASGQPELPFPGPRFRQSAAGKSRSLTLPHSRGHVEGTGTCLLVATKGEICLGFPCSHIRTGSLGPYTRWSKP